MRGGKVHVWNRKDTYGSRIGTFCRAVAARQENASKNDGTVMEEILAKPPPAPSGDIFSALESTQVAVAWFTSQETLSIFVFRFRMCVAYSGFRPVEQPEPFPPLMRLLLPYVA